VKIRVTWGDSSFTNVPASGFMASGTPATAQHTWTANGVYTLTARATDDSAPNLEGLATTRQVEVSDAWPPSVTSFSCGPIQYYSHTVTCSIRSADSDSATLQHVFTWGDGLTTTTSSAAPGTLQTATHTYVGEGMYTLSTVARDPDGQLSTPRTHVVDAVSPSVDLTDPYPGTIYMGCDYQASLAAISLPDPGPVIGSTPGTTGPPITAPRLPAFVRIGCVGVVTSDANSGVGELHVYVPGACQGFDSWIIANPAYYTQFEYPLCETGTGSVSVTAFDRQWNSDWDGQSVTTITSECGPVYDALELTAQVIEAVKDLISRVPPIMIPIAPQLPPLGLTLDAMTLPPIEPVISCNPNNPTLPPITPIIDTS
jgi:hypothetical protein